MSIRSKFGPGGQKTIRVVALIGILGVMLLSLTTVGFIEYSAQPAFCTNCHNMEPYYESWAESSHNGVPCIRCHYAPGIKAEAMGKLQAANQVVKYVTGAYGTKPWAEIEDAGHELGKIVASEYDQTVQRQHAEKFDNAQPCPRCGKTSRACLLYTSDAADDFAVV